MSRRLQSVLQTIYYERNIVRKKFYRLFYFLNFIFLSKDCEKFRKRKRQEGTREKCNNAKKIYIRLQRGGKSYFSFLL